MEVTVYVCECCKRQYRSDVKYDLLDGKYRDGLGAIRVDMKSTGIEKAFQGNICTHCAKDIYNAMMRVIIELRQGTKWRELVDNKYNHIYVEATDTKAEEL